MNETNNTQTPNNIPGGIPTGQPTPNGNGIPNPYMNGQPVPNGNGIPNPNMNKQSVPNGNPVPNPNMNKQPVPNGNPVPNPNMNMNKQPAPNGMPVQSPYMNAAPNANNYSNQQIPVEPPKNNSNLLKALVIGMIFLVIICLALGGFLAYTILNKDNADKEEVVTEEVVSEEEEEEEEPETEEEVETEEATTVEEESTVADTKTVPAGLQDAALSDFMFDLEGTVFQLPISYTELTEMGWTIDDYSKGEEDLIASNDFQYITFTKGESELSTIMYNVSGNTKAVKDCNIGGFSIYGRKDADITLARGITCDSTAEEIQAAYGTPDSLTAQSDYTLLKYSSLSEDEDTRAYVHFTIYKDRPDSNNIDIIYFAKTDADNTEVSTTVPVYLSEYTAPTKLSDSVYDTQFELDGDLYQLPCTLSAFTDNGWTVAGKDSDSIPSLNEETTCVSIEKGNNVVYLDMYNFSMNAELIENCAVFGVQFDPFYLKDVTADLVKMPGGLNLGSSVEEVEAACAGFDKNETSYSTSYTYTQYSDTELAIRYSFDTSSGLNPTPSIRIQNTDWNY